MNESSNDISYELQQLSGWLYDGRGGYSLGYLLEKFTTLPRATELISPVEHPRKKWLCRYWGGIGEEANIAENAACKLAIELFKQGILKPSNKERNTK